mmetsp:Transcript_18862/g.55334  ORF Transcript_18862/g.55334 Transcript_18862/m.55334 type:complete len:391 (-) Transcript_18862:711-1883(-)
MVAADRIVLVPERGRRGRGAAIRQVVRRAAPRAGDARDGRGRRRGVGLKRQPQRLLVGLVLRRGARLLPRALRRRGRRLLREGALRRRLSRHLLLGLEHLFEDRHGRHAAAALGTQLLRPRRRQRLGAIACRPALGRRRRRPHRRCASAAGAARAAAAHIECVPRAHDALGEPAATALAQARAQTLGPRRRCRRRSVAVLPLCARQLQLLPVLAPIGRRPDARGRGGAGLLGEAPRRGGSGGGGVRRVEGGEVHGAVRAHEARGAETRGPDDARLVCCSPRPHRALGKPKSEGFGGGVPLVGQGRLGRAQARDAAGGLRRAHGHAQLGEGGGSPGNEALLLRAARTARRRRRRSTAGAARHVGRRPAGRLEGLAPTARRARRAAAALEEG